MGIMTSPALVDIGTGIAFRPDANTQLWLPGQDDAYSATIRDRSGEGNDGTITGATWTRLDSGLWYQSFDGDDYVDCGNNSVLNFTTGDFSLEGWIVLDTANYTSENLIIGRGSINSDGWELSDGGNGRLQLYTHNAGANQESHGAINSIAADTWSHFAATRTGAVCKVFANGVDVTSVSGTHIDPVTNSRTLWIGRSHNIDRYLQGDLTLLRIYNRVLTDAEIAGHYNQERHLFGV